MEDATKTCDKKITRPRCKTDEERRERHLTSHRRYGNKPYKCELCSVVIKQAGKARHVKSKKHLKLLSETE